LTLLFRPLGAIIFGIAGDLYGRKWPLVVNLMMIFILVIGTVKTTTFTQFLIVRSLFGIGMGGIWGNAASMALENMPAECRGLFSGILQQGYAVGYVLAAIINLYVVPHSSLHWESLFYTGAALTAAVGIARMFFPESKQFLEQRERARQNPELQVTGTEKVKAFTSDAKKILRIHWKKSVYACILMALFNSMSHASQDMYPTYMQQSKGFSNQDASKATIIAMTGAVIGGILAGYYSQWFGRRATIMVLTIVGAAVIPLWVLPTSFGGLVAGAFLLQFCVQGAWGVVPIHLNELSPAQYRSSFPGISYQIGNMISSPMAQIASHISENWRVQTWSSKNNEYELVPGYAKTQAAMMSVIFVLLCIWAACGDEAKGSKFELARVAGEEVAVENMKEKKLSSQERAENDKVDVGIVDDEKAEVGMVENATGK